ncbi:MAG TPA: anthranilate synthase component I [Chitinivibrionales bacterium]|nr:anthranilate synthase component I [Chitinivibrionales bacterium]
MIVPSLEQVKNLAQLGQGNIIPVCHKILADTETPVSVWLKLYNEEPYSFLLESVTGGDKVARYSFIGGRSFATFRSNGMSWEITGQNAEKGEGDPVARLRALLARYRAVRVEGLPRLCGGAVGYFSYDCVRLFEEVPDKSPKENLVDEIFFGLYRDIIAFDNREHKLLLITTIETDGGVPLEEAYRDACHRLGSLEDKLAVRLASSGVTVHDVKESSSTFTREQYETAVEACKEYIRAGDVFQVVPSQRISVRVDANPFDIYRILRTVNPSPYMYFLSLNGVQVAGSSPEMMVRVENGMVEMRPIAGSRPRGATEAEDERLADELTKDPKETAEHIMLVDLGRNDVGRVSVYGSVRVEEMMHVEQYSHVMHLVSNVSGTLVPGKDALDALFACFPAGTLSGAPKIRAMEIIDELEPVRRGIYGGALGYIDFSGSLDTCIVIRTVVCKGGTAYIQAGAGIVADSVPSLEFDETMNKARALLTAINDAKSIIGRD